MKKFLAKHWHTLLLSIAVIVLFFLYVFQNPAKPDYSDILDKVEKQIRDENKIILDSIAVRDKRILKSEQNTLKLETKLKEADKRIIDLKVKYEKLHINIGQLSIDGTVDKSREYLSNPK